MAPRFGSKLTSLMKSDWQYKNQQKEEKLKGKLQSLGEKDEQRQLKREEKVEKAQQKAIEQRRLLSEKAAHKQLKERDKLAQKAETDEARKSKLVEKYQEKREKFEKKHAPSNKLRSRSESPEFQNQKTMAKFIIGGGKYNKEGDPIKIIDLSKISRDQYDILSMAGVTQEYLQNPDTSEYIRLFFEKKGIPITEEEKDEDEEKEDDHSPEKRQRSHVMSEKRSALPRSPVKTGDVPRRNVRQIAQKISTRCWCMDAKQDDFAVNLLPKQYGAYTPIETEGDGNCLFATISLFVAGAQDRSVIDHLRQLTAEELEKHASKYARHKLLVSNAKRMGGIGTILHSLVGTDLDDDDVDEATDTECIRAEGLATRTDARWSSMLQVMALSTVIGHPIQAVFPAVDHYAACIYNAKVKPLDSKRADKRYLHRLRHPPVIFWSRDSSLDNEAGVVYTPNHVVPLVLKC